MQRTTQKLRRVRTVPRLCGFYPDICLTTEEKARKNLSHGKCSIVVIVWTLFTPAGPVYEAKDTSNAKILKESSRCVNSTIFEVSGPNNTAFILYRLACIIWPSLLKTDRNTFFFLIGEQWTEHYCHVVGLQDLAPSVFTSRVHVSLPICL
jgi:hypothetical protein